MPKGETKRMKLLILVVVILLPMTGCEQLAEQSKPSSPAPSSVPERLSHPIGRFEKIQNFRVDVALDSQTGQLCKTWEWQSTNRNTPDPYETLPTCDLLYKTFPTTEKSEREGISVRTGTDNANGKKVFSCDGGKSWNWADGSGPRSSSGNIAQ